MYVLRKAGFVIVLQILHGVRVLLALIPPDPPLQALLSSNSDRHNASDVCCHLTRRRIPRSEWRKWVERSEGEIFLFCRIPFETITTGGAIELRRGVYYSTCSLSRHIVSN